ncbi:wd-40 repeat protein [Stylonychia lemnae]|uniref:Wd-40 repeat protein n=1 Tax=Stylonychia lemnae TaxID=5949 RepID=A0A078AYI0_STYLE|nr:wd-40 repeat protein [Stylonychia lemnae]|eukprot:CDW87224.1 wd-40 repeat protein [Stylonychia lemnae]
MASFIFDIFYSTYATQINKDQSDQSQIVAELENQEKIKENIDQVPNIWIKISTKVVCSLVLLFFLIYEIRQIRVQRRQYFNDGWNFFDFSLITAFTAFCIFDFISDNQDNLILIKILVIVLTFMKLFFFLRIFDGFSFLVQMMGGVFKDLKYFLIFFIIFILQFGMIFLVLFKAKQVDEYNGVNKLSYFLMAFRISSGDFQLEDYHNQDDGIVIFTWIIWIIAVLILNIVFMNFIIAVISESYERVMQKLVTESYRVKANMIVEREQLLNQNDLSSNKYFPNFIVVRRPLNTEIDDAGEWQGFIKDLKYTIRTSVAKSKGELIQNLHSIQTLNQQNNQKLEKINEALQLTSKNLSTNEGNEQQFNQQLKTQLDENQENVKNDFQQLKEEVKGLDTKVDGLETKVDSLDSKVDGLDTKVDGLDTKVGGLDQRVRSIQDDTEFIKTSLKQLLQKYEQ